MIVTLDRIYSKDGTSGILNFFGKHYFTCERPWLNNQPFVSCIPEGQYQVKPYHSAKFPDVWQVNGVVGRSHILFHVGNKPDNVSGCIAVGLERGNSPELWVGSSQLAINEMREKASGKEFELIIRPFSTANNFDVLDLEKYHER